MAQPKRVIIAGHSHADTLFGGFLRASVEPKLFKVDDEREIYGLVGGFPRTPDYWDTLVREARDSVVIVVWGGNDNNGFFLFEANPRFDFVRDDVAWFDPQAHLVPAAAVQNYFYSLAHLREVIPILQRLREVSGARIMLAETPPPRGDDAALREQMKLEYTAMAAEYGVSLDTVPITRRFTRLKLWRAMRDAFKQFAADAGVEYLPLPDWAFDEEGFLKPEYWHTDATHANRAYANELRGHIGEHLLP